MLDLIVIGKRIAEKRKAQGLTQNELADKLFVTHQAVSKWEQGKSVPSIDVLYELTKLFHISIDTLLDDADIEDTNIDRLFESTPRDIAINTFLRSDKASTMIDQFFYRLSKQERMYVINHVIHHKEPLQVHDIWPYLNNNERTYLLGSILSGTVDYNLQTIQTKLTTSEQLRIQARQQTGEYPYPMHYHSKH